jgi:hypothetical protein
VAIASTPSQLAQLLGVQQVLFCDCVTRQLLEDQPGRWPAATAEEELPQGDAPTQQPAAMEGVEQAAAAAAAAADDDEDSADDEAAELAGLLQETLEDECDASSGFLQDAEQLLEVQKPQGNWHLHACAALFVLLDVADADSYKQQQRQTVLQAVRCGNEAGNKVCCGRHRKMKGSRIFLIAKNGDVLTFCSCLAELAPLLGATRVTLQDELGDLQEKLQQQLAGNGQPGSGASLSRSSSEAAAAAVEVGQKRLGHEAGLSEPSSSKTNKVAASQAGVLTAAAAAGAAQQLPAMHTSGAVLRLRLTEDQAERARQQLQQQAQQWQQGQQPYVQPGLQARGVDAWKLTQLQQGLLDVQLSLTPGSCSQQPCMGINLRLGVSSLQEMAESR